MRSRRFKGAGAEQQRPGRFPVSILKFFFS